MPMQWNDQADARLFANVLKHHVVKLDYQRLAQAMGDNVTPKAISHRIAKIKEKAQAHRNRWDPYIRLVASPKRAASMKPALMRMLSEGDDDEGKGFVDLKNEDEQLFAAGPGGADGGGGVVLGGQMLSFDESGGGEVGDTVVAAADGSGGGGGDGDCGKYLLGVDGQGRWPVPASEFEVCGMYQRAEGAVGKDEGGIRPPWAAPSSCPAVVVNNGLSQSGGESAS